MPDYSVLQRRREIGIRIAIGARPGNIVGRVGVEGMAMVLLGTVAGLGIGMLSVHYVESLLFEARLADFSILAPPLLIIVASALLAAVPAAIRAARTDAVQMLRAE